VAPLGPNIVLAEALLLTLRTFSALNQKNLMLTDAGSFTVTFVAAACLPSVNAKYAPRISSCSIVKVAIATTSVWLVGVVLFVACAS